MKWDDLDIEVKLFIYLLFSPILIPYKILKAIFTNTNSKNCTCRICGYNWQMRSPHGKGNLPSRCPHCGTQNWSREKKMPVPRKFNSEKILESFLESDHKIVRVDVEGIGAESLSIDLNRRIMRAQAD